jgi:hypothetical protein
MGVQSTNYGGTEVRTVISYKGSDQPVGNETNPWAMFDDVFADLGSDPVRRGEAQGAPQERARPGRRKYARLVAQARAADDKKKIEQHLDGGARGREAPRQPGRRDRRLVPDPRHG